MHTTTKTNITKQVTCLSQTILPCACVPFIFFFLLIHILPLCMSPSFYNSQFFIYSLIYISLFVKSTRRDAQCCYMRYDSNNTTQLKYHANSIRNSYLAIVISAVIIKYPPNVMFTNVLPEPSHVTLFSRLHSLQ